jgi:hypothetical protein
LNKTLRIGSARASFAIEQKKARVVFGNESSAGFCDEKALLRALHLCLNSSI